MRDWLIWIFMGSVIAFNIATMVRQSGNEARLETLEGAVQALRPSTEGVPVSEGAGVAAPSFTRKGGTTSSTDGKGGDTNAAGRSEHRSEPATGDMTTPRPEAKALRRGAPFPTHDWVLEAIPDELSEHDHMPKACVMEFNTGLKVQWFIDQKGEFIRVASSEED